MVMDEQGGIAGRIDVAALAPGANRKEILAACGEARELQCASVCVAPAWVAEATQALKGSGVAVGAVIGFPLGASTTLSKVFEALECIKHGATELDIVIHVGAARSGEFKFLREEAKEIRKRTSEAVHKFILEMPLLSEDQLRRAVKALAPTGPAFLKTGTGTVGEVRPEDVARLRKLAPAGIGIKAAGGIRTPEQAWSLLEAGATRIGTSRPRSLVPGPGGGR